MSAQRLLLLCSALAGLLLLLVVPYRMQQSGKRSWIRYDFLWEKPYSPRGKHDTLSPVCPDNGPFMPLLLAEYAALTIGALVLNERLGRSDTRKLQDYPGYQRGF